MNNLIIDLFQILGKTMVYYFNININFAIISRFFIFLVCCISGRFNNYQENEISWFKYEEVLIKKCS